MEYTIEYMCTKGYSRHTTVNAPDVRAAINEALNTLTDCKRVVSAKPKAFFTY